MAIHRRMRSSHYTPKRRPMRNRRGYAAAAYVSRTMMTKIMRVRAKLERTHRTPVSLSFVLRVVLAAGLREF